MHHELYKYRNTFLYRLQENNWSRFVHFTEIRVKVGAAIFFMGLFFLNLGTFLSFDILCSSHVFLLVFFLPCVLSIPLSYKELFFSMSVRIESNRVVANHYPRWMLWLCSIFANLMVVGGLSLSLFASTCLLLANKEVVEEEVYIEHMEENTTTHQKTARIVFSDGVKTSVCSGSANWHEGAYSTIQVRESLLGIRIYVE